MRFTKMHGIGNDYIYVSTFTERVDDPAALARRMSDRHFGVGADGLVLIGPDPEADFRMRMFNSDGSEGAMCGNAARCVARYVYERALTGRTDLTLATAAGLRHLQLRVEGGRVTGVAVDMGAPEMLPEDPKTGSPLVPVTAAGQTWQLMRVSMGNPHAVCFGGDPERLPVEAAGPAIARDPLFPEGVNVEFVQALSRQHLRMRVWERGSGETLACGTGACAAVAAGVRLGLCDRSVTVSLRGGDLDVRWDPDTGHMIQEGPAVFVFDGEWPEEEM